MSCVQLPEGGFQVVYPLGLWSRSSGVVKVLYGYGCSKIVTIRLKRISATWRKQQRPRISAVPAKPNQTTPPYMVMVTRGVTRRSQNKPRSPEVSLPLRVWLCYQTCRHTRDTAGVCWQICGSPLGCNFLHSCFCLHPTL